MSVLFHTYAKLRQASKHKINWQYAIGEIVLIFIGITLAIAFNNWNEGRMDRLQGVAYVNEIHSDLKDDLEQINIAIEHLQSQFEGSIAYLEVIEAKKQTVIDSDDLFYKIAQLGVSVRTKRKQKTWDALLASGQKNRIYNADLGNKLSEFYTNYDYGIAHFNSTAFEIRNKVRYLLLSEPYTSQELLERLANNSHRLYSKKRLNSWLNHPEGQEIIGQLGVSSLNNIRFFKEAKNEAESIILYLEENYAAILD